MRKNEIIILGIVLVSFIIGNYFYAQMPEKMASHWNFRGEVDGYISKFWGLFLMPLISLGLLLFFIFIPKIDPLGTNIEKFRKYYDNFAALIILFLFYLYTLTIFWNLGKKFSMPYALTPAFAILFYYLGVLIKNSQRNYSIGIKTPWTLSNDKVWEKTHQLGGKLFKIAGIIALLGFFFPGQAFFLILLPAILILIFTIAYSYYFGMKFRNK